MPNEQIRDVAPPFQILGPDQGERLTADPRHVPTPVELHDVVPLQPRLEHHVTGGRRRPPPPRIAPLPAIGREPPHRISRLERDHTASSRLQVTTPPRPAARPTRRSDGTATGSTARCRSTGSRGTAASTLTPGSMHGRYDSPPPRHRPEQTRRSPWSRSPHLINRPHRGQELANKAVNWPTSVSRDSSRGVGKDLDRRRRSFGAPHTPAVMWASIIGPYASWPPGPEPARLSEEPPPVGAPDVVRRRGREVRQSIRHVTRACAAVA